MKRFLLLSFILLSTTALKSQNRDFNIDQFYAIENAHSYLGFQVKYMGYAMVRGRFAQFNGTVRYDENEIRNTSVTLSINVASIDTDNDFRDNDLRSDNWFNAETYPTITFQSSEAIPSGEGMVIKGLLTIKDVTREVSIQMEKPSGVIKDIRGDAQVVFTGKLQIDRTDYHVEGKNWSKVKEGITGVENEVNIEVTILGKQIKQDNFRNWVRNPKTPQGKIFEMVEAEGLERGLHEFDVMIKDDSVQVNARALNLVGYMLLKQGKVEDALKVFEKNREAFPEDPNVFDSLGEAWAHKDLKKAKEFYAKAVEMDPTNINAKEILRHLN